MDANGILNRISLQLMKPPESSRQALVEGRTSPAPAAAEFALESARDWLKSLLKPAYHPSRNTVFLAFPMENGVCDTIRAIYHSGNLEISVGESKHLLAITLKGLPPAADASRAEYAQAAARRVFVMDDRINLHHLGTEGENSYGSQDLSRGYVNKEWPHWVDVLSWMTGPATVSFVTLKADGEPTREVLSSEEADNIHWF